MSINPISKTQSPLNFKGYIIDVYFPYTEDLNKDGTINKKSIKRKKRPCLIINMVVYNNNTISLILAPGTSKKIDKNIFGNFLVKKDKENFLDKDTKFKISPLDMIILDIDKKYFISLNEKKYQSYFQNGPIGFLDKRGVLAKNDISKITKHLNRQGIIKLINDLSKIKEGKITKDNYNLSVYFN